MRYQIRFTSSWRLGFDRALPSGSIRYFLHEAACGFAMFACAFNLCCGYTRCCPSATRLIWSLSYVTGWLTTVQGWRNHRGFWAASGSDAAGAIGAIAVRRQGIYSQ